MKGLETRYEDVDLVIVRENTEDLYAGIEHMVGPDAAESIKIITRAASERIARFAFDYAVANGRRKVTAVHKANIMKLSDGLFLESCRTVAADYEGGSSSRTASSTTCACSSSRSPTCTTCSSCRTCTATSSATSAAGLVGGLGVAPGGEHRDRGGGLRAGPRLGAQVRRPEQGQPDRADPVRRADAPPPRRAGGGRAGRDGASARSSPRAGHTTYDLGGDPGRASSPTRSSSASARPPAAAAATGRPSTRPAGDEGCWSATAAARGCSPGRSTASPASPSGLHPPPRLRHLPRRREPGAVRRASCGLREPDRPGPRVAPRRRPPVPRAQRPADRHHGLLAGDDPLPQAAVVRELGRCSSSSASRSRPIILGRSARAWTARARLTRGPAGPGPRAAASSSPSGT